MAGVSGRAETPEAAAGWRTLTQGDVEAAYHLLHDNHPGATPEAGDPAFVAALEAAHAHAAERAATVASYEGYVATLGEFANGMADGHIYSNARFLPRTVTWAGLIAARRGPNWVIARAESPADPTLAGARLVDCDGRPIDEVAREALRFRTDVALEPSLALRGAWLLVDEGNPFLKRPAACVVEQGGQTKTVSLTWRSIGRSPLIADHWDRPYGLAGYGVRNSGAGVWIALQELGPEAPAVVEAARAKTEAIRAAPYVVVDLRGNGGGADTYGRALAEVIYGPAAVLAALGPAGAAGCDEVFRASPENIAATAKDADLFRRRGEAQAAADYDRALVGMRAAAAAGKSLAGDLKCREPAHAPASRIVPAARGKVYVLTDVACFSSCIQTVGFFRALGATQVGQSTGADTHFSEAREIVLPSGLATFSTLRALMPDQPRAIGPYAPKLTWTGDMADTAALETWVAGMPR
jgi:hypothetical protein